AEQDDPAVRLLAVGWCAELLTAQVGAPGPARRVLADVLVRLSHDGSPEVQRMAVLALGRGPDQGAFQRLCGLLKQGPPPLRAPVGAAAAGARAQQAGAPGAEALGRRKQVVAALQKALDDCAVEVVVEAAEALGTLGVPEAAPVLAGLLRPPAEHARQAAAAA